MVRRLWKKPEFWLLIFVLAGGVISVVNKDDTSHSSPAAPASVASPVSSFQEADWRPPKALPKGIKRSAIQYGEAIFNLTPRTLPQFHLNALACSSCHIAGGIDKKALPLMGAPTQFPDYTSRDKRLITLDQRINECFTRSENGRPLPPFGKEMASLEAYFSWISTGIPEGTKPSWIGNGSKSKLKGNLPTPDSAHGMVIFRQVCSACHGADGQGAIAPPLWGPRSFNAGAGMHNIKTMAEFVHNNMPATAPGSISLPDAADVAAFVLSHPRPPAPASQPKDPSIP